MIAEKPRCCQCVLTEKLGNTGLFKSAYGSGLLKDPALGTLGKLAYSAVSEGIEEFAEGLAAPLLKNLTYDPTAVCDDAWLRENLRCIPESANRKAQGGFRLYFRRDCDKLLKNML